MNIIERIRAHFEALPVGTVEVPEWGDESGPLVLYHRAMTLEERQKFLYAQEREGNLAASATIIVTKALDAQGNRLFTIEHKRVFLKQADGAVVLRVAGQLMITPSVEEMGNASSRTIGSD